MTGTTNKSGLARVNFTSFWRLPGLLSLSLVVLDQVSKAIVVRHCPIGWQQPVIAGFFNLVHVRNTGAAWGILAEHTWLLGLLSVLAALLMVIFFRRLSNDQPFMALVLGVIHGGIVGNMIDRLFRGSVVDFLDFEFAGRHWPAFNIADSAISVGVVLVLLASFFLPAPVEDSPDKA
ncbi:MAG: signal peptidase II [Lentisphaerae bacterium]|nr:signal peptidase II [Lentisphaerota bacterium]